MLAKPSSVADSTVPVPSTWPCTKWPPRRSAARSGSSRFTCSPDSSGPSERAAQGLRHHVGAEGAVGHAHGGQADAVDGDRVALRELRGEAGLHLEARAGRLALDRAHGAQLLHEAREHLTTPSCGRVISTSSVDPLDLAGQGPRARRRSPRRPGPRARRARRRPPASIGATNRRASSISPASRNAPARCGPPSSSSDWMPRAPSSVERGAHARRLVLARGDDDLHAGGLERVGRRARTRRASRQRSSGTCRGGAHELARCGQAGLGVEHHAARLARDALDARGEQRVVARAPCRCRRPRRRTRRASGGAGAGSPRRRSTGSRRSGWRPCRRASSPT